MKEIWYNHIVNNKQYWCNGFTLKRLEKVKEFVFKDEPTMYDLLIRHNAKEMTPEQMIEFNKDIYWHCIGNLSCNISSIMFDLKMIKG